MNTTEHLLTILGEECSEISQAVSKSLRFGLNDLIAVANMLVDYQILPKAWQNEDKQIDKQEKLNIL